jgi:hypothetical protein
VNGPLVECVGCSVRFDPVSRSQGWLCRKCGFTPRMQGTGPGLAEGAGASFSAGLGTSDRSARVSDPTTHRRSDV